MKRPKFPKPGGEYERWTTYLVDAVIAASALGHLATPWILEVFDEGMAFDKLARSGGFQQLDSKVSIAIQNILPGNTHPLGMEITLKKKMLLDAKRIMTGRQHLFLFHNYYDIEDKDKEVVDINRLQKIRMKNADLRKYLFE